MGERTALSLARASKTIDAFLKLELNTLLAISDIGEETAQTVADFLANVDEVAMVRRLIGHNLEIEPPAETAGGALEGKTFVLTGTLTGLTREDAEARIIAAAGKVSSSVSRKTNFVVVGTDPGSKAAKARELGVQILDERQFLELFS